MSSIYVALYHPDQAKAGEIAAILVELGCEAQAFESVAAAEQAAAARPNGVVTIYAAAESYALSEMRFPGAAGVAAGTAMAAQLAELNNQLNAQLQASGRLAAPPKAPDAPDARKKLEAQLDRLANEPDYTLCGDYC